MFHSYDEGMYPRVKIWLDYPIPELYQLYMFISTPKRNKEKTLYACPKGVYCLAQFLRAAEYE